MTTTLASPPPSAAATSARNAAVSLSAPNSHGFQSTTVNPASAGSSRSAWRTKLSTVERPDPGAP